MSSIKPHTLVFKVRQTSKTLDLTATFDGETQTYTVPERRQVCAKLKVLFRLLNPWSSFLGTIHDFYVRVRKATGRPGIHALLTEVGQRNPRYSTRCRIATLFRQRVVVREQAERASQCIDGLPLSAHGMGWLPSHRTGQCHLGRSSRRVLSAPSGGSRIIASGKVSDRS